jgi:tetratricopeptide (TPR) repeat protein
MTDRPGEGARLARRAVDLGRDDAVALTRGGHALAHLTDDVAGGIALLDRALVLNPNLAPAWFLAGFLRTWNGEPDAAIEHFAHAMRLNPLDPELYRMQAGLAAAHLFAGRFDAASSCAEKAFRELPSFLMVVSVIAASHALADRPDEAQRAMKHLRELDPTLRVSNLADWLPIRRPQDLATFANGLRKAGLRSEARGFSDQSCEVVRRGSIVLLQIWPDASEAHVRRSTAEFPRHCTAAL